jgi:SAM-dependent methyltransferase
MLNNYPKFSELCRLIASQDKFQSKRIKKIIESNNVKLFNFAEDIVVRVLACSTEAGKDYDMKYLADNYLWYTKILKIEELHFAKEKKYRYENYDEVYKKVYGDDNYMFNYVNGLAITQIFWPNHYLVFRFFIDEFCPLISASKFGAEVGVGHGLFHAEMLRNSLIESSTLIDVSDTALNMTEKMIKHSLKSRRPEIIKFNNDIQKNIPIDDNSLDVLLLGEIIEHISNVDFVLSGLSKKMKSNGKCYFSTAANGPAEDHILLFKNTEEIRNLLIKNNWTIKKELAITLNNIPLDKAEKEGENINYCAVLEPKKT